MGADFCSRRVPEQRDLTEIRVLKDADSVLGPGVAFSRATRPRFRSASLPLKRAKSRQAFIGMHFMNPVPVMVLVEVIRGQRDERRHLSDHHGALRKAGKKPGLV